jgi:hypothetical protein
LSYGAAMAVEIKLAPGNGPYYFWRHDHVRHLVSLLYAKRQISQDMDNLFPALLEQK